MLRSGAGFALASLTPVPLLVLGATLGGAWAWGALLYLTLFAFAMDELIAWADAPDSEFPAGDLLAAALAVAHFAVFGLVVWAFGRGIAPVQGAALFLGAGLFFGQISNANAHELIHRGSRVLHGLGKWVYISLLFGHHSSAHPLVHHRHVGTARDPNTARAGEGFYAFAARAWPAGFGAGLRAETARRGDAPAWRHPYALYLSGALGFMALAFLIGGWTGLAAFLGLALFAQSQLLVSDYVQHYGLVRREADGKPEPVGPEHSWNAPHVFTGHMMLHAPRHSAHHLHPARRFPELDVPDVQIAPLLPLSLPAMSFIALAPPLWRCIMDPRLAYWQSEPLGDPHGQPLAA
ncbi:Alkane-1 monooxygenase [Candidatus Rhodobacter oscarellae]|uniref:Alkane-1 monooxygenase n=2 Tax=Candidatus Rhodobacter oscarellae TaxID=1675527 RepID=A0A0J9E3U3_9RHOB|nr:Alkane-1 monooxygenase [Candidatus Rhodobacter lobularis]